MKKKTEVVMTFCITKRGHYNQRTTSCDMAKISYSQDNRCYVSWHFNLNQCPFVCIDLYTLHVTCYVLSLTNLPCIGWFDAKWIEAVEFAKQPFEQRAPWTGALDRENRAILTRIIVPTWGVGCVWPEIIVAVGKGHEATLQAAVVDDEVHRGNDWKGDKSWCYCYSADPGGLREL